MPDEPLLLTEPEAAKRLAISPRKLWQMRHDGLVPFVRIGGAIRYPLDALHRWVETQTHLPVTKETA